jgi:hypothetical protein
MLLSAPMLETVQTAPAHQGDLFSALEQALQGFQPICLADMSGRRLMKRMDTKYLFQAALLPQILTNLAAEYDVLDVGGVRMQRYRTCYYDTPDFQLYQQHHNGQRDRFKLRIRSYLETAVDFLEVKRKDNHDRTHKSRLQSESADALETPGAAGFLQENFPLRTGNLMPKLTNRFFRIALVSRHERERLTIDLDLHFQTPGACFGLSGLAVAEVKQPHFSVHSAFIRQMRRAGKRPTRFSKYCVGAALAYPHLKRNAFKPLFLDFQKLALGGA